MKTAGLLLVSMALAAAPALGAVGSLSVQVSDEGARVSVDGRSLTGDPLTAEGLNPGPHEVIVVGSDGTTAIVRVPVYADGETVVEIALGRLGPPSESAEARNISAWTQIGTIAALKVVSSLLFLVVLSPPGFLFGALAITTSGNPTPGVLDAGPALAVMGLAGGSLSMAVGLALGLWGIVDLIVGPPPVPMTPAEHRVRLTPPSHIAGPQEYFVYSTE